MKLSDLLVPSTKYSKFRCDTYKKFSANPGILYPVWMQLLNPGESASVDLRSVIRTWPVESPLMGSMKVRFVTAAFNLKNYAMALEGYKRNFDWRSVTLPHFAWSFPTTATESLYFTNKTLTAAQAGSLGRDESEIVTCNFAHYLGVQRTSLADYLGYPDGWLPSLTNYSGAGGRITKSALPFICYYDFYRNYLINPQETNAYIFMSAPAVKDFPNYQAVDDSTKGCLVNESVVGAIPVSLIDDWINDIHKYYDGSSSATGTIKTASTSGFNDILTWEARPASVNTSSLFTARGNIFSSFHGGLVSTMFDSDINTQWLSYANYDKLNEVRINTSTDSSSSEVYTSFSEIVKASSLWDFVTKSVNSDGTYGDFIGNQFGVSVKGDMNIPQIVHIYDTLLSFDDITSQADTSTADSGAVVGQQFGVGRSYGQSNRFKVFNKDGNYIMLMTFMWITPQVCYKDGLNWLSHITSFADLYQPSFDNYAMQERLQENVNCTIPGYVGSQSIYSDYDLYDNVMVNPTIAPVIEAGAINFDSILGYQPAYSEYKTDVDVVHGLFREELDYYTIIRKVPYLSTSSLHIPPSDVVSSYVYSNPGSTPLPAEQCKNYTLPFAVQGEDCCQVQLRVDATITRAMSKNVNPNIK